MQLINKILPRAEFYGVSRVTPAHHYLLSGKITYRRAVVQREHFSSLYSNGIERGEYLVTIY